MAQHEGSFRQRLGEAVEAKKRLARASALLLGADETVFIDSSTTAYYATQRMLAETADAPGVTYLANLVPATDLFSTTDPSLASMLAHLSEVSLVMAADASDKHVERLEDLGVEVRIV